MSLSLAAFLEASFGAFMSGLAAVLLFRAWVAARDVRTLLLISLAMAGAALTAAASAFVAGLQVIGAPLTLDQFGVLRLVILALLATPGVFGLWLYWDMTRIDARADRGERNPDIAGEYGRLLAERDRLIADGADPDDLLSPEPPA